MREVQLTGERTWYRIAPYLGATIGVIADATHVQIGADTGNIDWQGSVFAPRATVVLARGASLYGALIAWRVEQTGTVRLPGIAAACLPPPCVDPGPGPGPGPGPEPPPLPPDH